MGIAALTQIQDEQRYRDNLRAAAVRASQYLTTGSADSIIPAILASIGESFQVDRVLVLENQFTDVSALVSLCYIWQQPSVPQISTSFFSEYPSNSAEVGRWLMPLLQGKRMMATLQNTTGAVADLFRKLEMKSILIVPIMIGGALWGSVGIDSCRTVREWTLAETDLLEIVANLIGTTILHDRYAKLLRSSEERFRTVAEAAQDGIIVVNSRGMVQYWNLAAERILGYSAEEALGKDVHEWLAPERFRALAAKNVKAFASAGLGGAVGRTRELTALRKDGVEIPVEIALASMQLDGEWCAVGLLRDISDRKEAEQRILWLARNDVLTGLPNRSVFVEEVQRAILRYQRSANHFAVYYLDLDHFKDVNDTLGHSAGDELLKLVAKRLQSTIRDTDKIARFGGDEFAILTSELSNPTDAGIVAGKLLGAMSPPFIVNGHEIHSGITIGIASCSNDEEDAETLLAHADVALYHAKSEGRGTFRVFTPEMHNQVRQRVTLLAELRDAIAHRELFLAYQPQVDMETRVIVGLEALLRWRHPVRGIISPGVFIPAAENSALIISLGQWVLLEVCRQIRAWLDTGLKLPVVALNVSPTQFRAPSDLNAEIAATLQKCEIKPEMLEVELTETALMHASQSNSNILQDLRDQGIRVAIDDFGTGYSCLDYLRRFPASRIKIAQTFVADITHDAGSAAITRAAISLGRELGLAVIAEGVETPEQVALLKLWGCKEAQGFYYARPLSSEKVCAALRAGRILPEM